MDLIGKIRRTITCQVNRFHRWLFCYMRNEKRVSFFSNNFPRLYISYYYRNWVGYFPNYKNPRDFNEKLILLSLKNRKNPLLALCADKYAVREYVTEKVGDDILNTIYGVYDSENEIPFDSLPNQFVIKITNASGYNIICEDKFKLDIDETKQKLNQWLKDSQDFGLTSCEWQYANIKPRILVEKYLSSLGESSIIDYKFNCIRGNVHSCFVAYDRSKTDSHGSVSYDHYDKNWNLIENAIKPKWHINRKIISKPVSYDKMLHIASKLSEDFDYVRVDLYEIDGNILFGELTFSPNGYVQDYYEQFMLDELGKILT